MANPVINTLTSNIDETNNDTIASASVSPTSGSLLIVIHGNNGGDTVSSIALGGTLSVLDAWTHVQADQGGAVTCISYSRYDTGSGAITITLTNKNNRKHIHVLEATGFDTATPVTDSNTATGSSSTPSVSLTGVDTGNTVVGACTLYGAGLTTLTPDQGTQEYNTTTLGPGQMTSMSDETSPGSTVSFTPDVTGTWVVSAIEITAAASGDLTKTFNDSINNWSEDVSLLLAERITKTDDLDNWLDARNPGYGYLLEKFDDLDSWLDNTNRDLAAAGGDLEDSFANSIANWNDNVDLVLSLEIAKTDTLNAWSEATDKLLALLPAFDDSFTLSDNADKVFGYLKSPIDSLNNWLDDEAHIFDFLVEKIDDLDAWLDSKSPLLAYLLDKSDDLDAWNDSRSLNLYTPELAFSDDLDNWLDNTNRDLAGGADITRSFGDSIANWSDGKNTYLWDGEYVYTILLHDTNSSIFGVWKAADPTSSWSFVSDSAVVLATNIQSYWIFQSADKRLHIATQEAGGRVGYHRFNPNLDIWEIVDETVDSTVNSAITNIQCGVSLAVRSDGDVVILYTDHDGSDASVSYARRESGTWTSGIDVASSAGDDVLAGSVVRGSTDRMHFFYTYDPAAGDNQARHRALTSANALQNEQTLDSSVFADLHAFTHGDLTDSNTIAIGRTTDAASSVITVSEATSANEPTWTHNSVSDTAADVQNGSLVGSVSTHGDNLHLIYSRDSDNDLYRDKDTGTGWNTDIAVQTSVTANRLSTNVFDRGGTIRLAYLWDDGGTSKYGEISLAAAALLSRAVSSDLDNWSDFIKRRFDYLLARTDDLDNWNDSVSKFLLGILGYAFNDDAANWADQLGRGHGQLHSDSFTLTEALALLLGYFKAVDDNLANWNDAVAQQLFGLLLRAFADDLNNWNESVSRDLLHRIPKGDTLSMDDGIERFGQLLISKFDTLTQSDYEQLVLGYWKSFSDSMTLTDGIQKFLQEPNLQWEPSDTLTMSDAIERFMQTFLAKSDLMTLTDAVSVAAILVNQSSDTLSLSDAYSRILAYLIAKSDTLSMSDARQVLVGHLLALSDSFTFTDADAHVIGQLLAYSDSLTLTDSQDLLLRLRKTLSDTLSMSDDLEMLLAYLLQLSDTLSMADGFSKELGGISEGERAVSDSITFSDSTERLLRTFLNRSDTLILSDSLQLLLSLLIANLNDDLNNWADGFLRAEGLQLQRSDVLTLSDAALLVLRHIIRKSDALSPSDGLAMLGAYYLSVSEVMALSDASRLIKGYLKAIFDDADNWQDSLVRVLGLRIEAGSDLDTWAQAVALELSHWLSLGDGLALVDGTSRFAEYLLNRSDTLSLSDVLTKIFGYCLSLTDSLNSWADAIDVFSATIGGLYLSKASDLDAWADAVSATLGTVATIIKFVNEAFSEPLLTNQAIIEVLLANEALSEALFSGESLTEVDLATEAGTEAAFIDGDFDASE